MKITLKSHSVLSQEVLCFDWNIMKFDWQKAMNCELDLMGMGQCIFKGRMAGISCKIGLKTLSRVSQ